MSNSIEAVKHPKPIEPEKYTIKDAFDYFEGMERSQHGLDHSGRGDANLEKIVRSVALQLEWLSQHENEAVPGYAAHGMAEILEQCADEIADRNSRGDAQ